MGIFSFIMNTFRCIGRRRRILKEGRNCRLAVAFNTTIDYKHLKIKGQIMILNLNANEFIVSTLQPVDAAGVTASYQKGTISWSTSDPTVVSVLQDTTNELVATITAVSAGTATITYTGTNLAGQQLVGTVDVTITAVALNDAVQFLITFGDPQLQTTSTTTTTSTTEVAA